MLLLWEKQNQQMNLDIFMVNLGMGHGHSMVDDPEDYQHRVGDPKTDLSLHLTQLDID